MDGGQSRPSRRRSGHSPGDGSHAVDEFEAKCRRRARFQRLPGNLEFVEVWVRLTGEVERYLLVKREEFVCVLEQVTKSALRSPEPLHRALPV